MTTRFLSAGHPGSPNSFCASAGNASAGPRPAGSVPCDTATGVLFTIHVRERAVACALSQQALAGLSGSEGRVAGGAKLARVNSLRVTMATLDLQKNGSDDVVVGR